MLKTVGSHVRHNVVSYLALFVALGGTSAYAANEWTGANIVDESLTGADVRGKPGTSTTAAVDGSLSGADISGQAANSSNGTPYVEGSLTGDDVRGRAATSTTAAVNGSLTGADVSGQPANPALGQPFVNGSLTGSDVADNSLQGADVLESSLGRVPDADKLDGKDSTAFLAANAPAGGHLTGTYPNPSLGGGVVDTPQLADEAVTGSKIARTAIDASKIANGNVLSNHIASDSVLSNHIVNGEVRGADLGPITLRTATESVPGGGTPRNGNWDTGRATVSCAAGEVRLGGGADWDTSSIVNKELLIVESSPFGTGSWDATGGNDTGTAETLRVHAICLAI